MDSELLVLVVDDEAAIVEIVRATLEDGGYSVEAAFRAADALQALEQHSGKLSALVTDVNLGPGETGWTLARRARELQPNLPVVYMSAAAGDEWASEGVPHSLFVSKPFAPAQILTAISGLITKTSSQPKPLE